MNDESVWRRIAELFSGERESDVLAWILTITILVSSFAIVLFSQRPDWSVRAAMLGVAAWALFFSHKPAHRLLITSAILVLAAITMFFRLGEGSLYDWDEAYYAQVSRELVVSRRWGTLTFAGNPFWHKPPLYFWLTALVSDVGGLNEFTARFVSAASAVATIGLTLFFGARLFSWGAGAAAALLLLTVENESFSHWYNFVGQGRAAMLETTLTLFLLASFILVWEAGRRPHLVCWIGISAGLAVMTKSWPGFGAFGLPLIYAILTGDFRNQRHYWLLAIVLMGAVILPWHVWQIWTHGMPFLHDYFVVNVFGRIFGIVQQKPRGPFFYLDILKQGFSHFAYAVLLAFVWSLWTALKTGGRQKLLLLIWITVPLVAFSLATTKLGWYIILIYPAIALLAAQTLAELAGYRLAVAGVAAVMAFFSFRLPAPIDGSPHVRQFAHDAAQILPPEVPIYVYNDDDCNVEGTMTSYFQSDGWNVAPSFVYYLDRTLLCTNEVPKSAKESRGYFLVDTSSMQGPQRYDRVLLRRGSFVLLGPENLASRNGRGSE
jgi:hypothetical protein